MPKVDQTRGSRKVKSCWRKPVPGATSFRKARHRRGWFLIDVAREIGVSADRLGRVERGTPIRDDMEIKAKLRKLYAGSCSLQKVRDPWKGQPFPTGYQLKMAMQAHGLTHRELAALLQNKNHGASDCLWWGYLNGDIDNVTKRPRTLPVGLQKLAAKFVRMTLGEIEGVRNPGATMRVFNK